MKKVLLGVMATITLSTAAQAQNVTLGRFFGACEDAGTDTKVSVGEACIIQSIINAASAELDGISVETLPTDWGNFYDQIKASYAGGNPPDIHVMHRHRVPEFAGLGAVADLSADLAGAGIDPGLRRVDDHVFRSRVLRQPVDVLGPRPWKGQRITSAEQRSTHQIGRAHV